MNKVYLLSDDCYAALTVADSRKACVQYLVEYHYVTPYDSVWDKEDGCWKEIHELMYESPDLITFDEFVDWLIANWDDKEFNEYYHIEEISIYKECV
jgi:hypothetical protein